VDPLFVPLPARPMVRLVLDVGDRDQEATLRYVRAQLAALDPEAVVRIQLEGPNSQRAAGWLTAARLRELAPASMNVSLPLPRARFSAPRRN
jgi:hypothetical protein